MSEIERTTTEKLIDMGEELRKHYYDVLIVDSMLRHYIDDFSADDLNQYNRALHDAYRFIQVGLDFAAMQKTANAGFPELAWDLNHHETYCSSK